MKKKSAPRKRSVSRKKSASSLPLILGALVLIVIVAFIDAMKMLLREFGDYEVFVIHEGEKAYQRLKKEAPDLIILDVRDGIAHREDGSILDLLRLDPQTKTFLSLSALHQLWVRQNQLA